MGPLLFFVLRSPEMPEGKYREMLVKGGMGAVFSLVLLYITILQVLRRGKISINREGGEIYIWCQKLRKTRELRLGVENLVLKVQRYKGEELRARVRYGSWLFTLAEKGGEEKLVLCALAKRESAVKLCGVMSHYLTVEDEENIQEAIANSRPSDTWSEWSQKTINREPFLGRASVYVGKVRIKKKTNKIVLKPFSIPALIAGLISLMFGGIFLYIGIIGIEGDKSGIITRVMITIFGLCSLIFFLIGISRTISVILYNDSGSVELNKGYWPFLKVVRLEKEDLSVRLFRCTTEEKKYSARVGQTVLGLVRGESELILGASVYKDKLRPAFELIREFLGQEAEDEAGEILTLEDGTEVLYSTTSLLKEHEPTTIRKQKEWNNDSIVWIKKAKNNILAVLGLGMGIFLASGPFWSSEKSGVIDWKLGLLSWPVGGVLIGFGIWWLREYWLKRCLVIDRASGIVGYKSHAGAKFNHVLCNTDDIAALQICSVIGMVRSGNSESEKRVWELNIIVRDRIDERHNLNWRASKSIVLEQAEKVATFLGVVVVDDDS